MDMERVLESQVVEGEIGLVIDYAAGTAVAINVLQAAMGMIEALDELDMALIGSINTSLQPVSVLNDVQHSSLKMLLARALKNAPDELIGNLDWKKWVGGLLVKGKYKLLQNLEADAPEINRTLQELEADYKNAPIGLLGYSPPTVERVREALDKVQDARSALPGQRIEVQTELGDIIIPETKIPLIIENTTEAAHSVTNRGTEFFKVKSPDMIGSSQWQVIRNGRTVRVDMIHQNWIDAYHARAFSILPGDSLKCEYEETVTYDAIGTEIDRRLAIVEVLEVISPPMQQRLI